MKITKLHIRVNNVNALNSSPIIENHLFPFLTLRPPKMIPRIAEIIKRQNKDKATQLPRLILLFKGSNGNHQKKPIPTQPNINEIREKIRRCLATCSLDSLLSILNPQLLHWSLSDSIISPQFRHFTDKENNPH